MPIKAKADVGALIAALAADDSAKRDAAVARLTIIGEPAGARLADEFESRADPLVRVGILRVFESIAGEHALPVARRGLAAGGDVGVAAVAVLAELVRQEESESDAAALEALLSASSDAALDRRVRAAAVGALESVPGDVRQAVAGLPPDSPEQVVWDEAAAGRLPDNPATLRDAVTARAAEAPLADVRRIVETVKAREALAPKRREEWCAVRGALHQALALRDSRIALYDLRETLESTAIPLPATFVGAAQAIGDASVLEPLAVAFSRAAEPRWRQQLADAFHAIVRRERITPRHSAMRRALAKAPDLRSN